MTTRAADESARQPSVRIATFNCEWRRTNSADASVIRERVSSDDVDIICLTETHHDYFDGHGFTITSAAPGTGPNSASRRKVLLWNRQPWSQVACEGPAGMPPGRYVAGTTETPIGPVQFMGVVIPYSFAGVRFGTPRRSPWELHLGYLEALDRNLAADPRRSVIVGDFNQRVPRKYQPKSVFTRLEEVLGQRFAIASAGVLQPMGRQAIDHICHSHDLVAEPPVTITNERPTGGRISDHFGVRVQLREAASF